jgi:phosphorylcholine metabolism protein LicD
MHGTLLGAHREGDLIQGDDDIDYGIWEQDYEELVSEKAGYQPLRKDLRAKGYHIPKYGQVHYINPPKECPGFGLYMDNWVYRVVDGTKPSEKGTYVQYTMCKPGTTAQRYARRHFTKLSQVNIAGNPFPAPSQAERLLEFIYGPEWRFPMDTKANTGTQSCS